MRQATLDAIAEVKRALEGIEAARARLASRPSSLGERGLEGVFTRYLDHGSKQLTWLQRTLESATALAGVASEVGDSGMELSILQMSGPRLQSAMFGTLLLATWVDFLQLADALLRDCPMCGSEKLFADLHRVQSKLTPTLEEFASEDSQRIEAATTAMPALMGELTHEFDTIRREARSAMEVGGKVVVAAQVMELLALISTLKMSLPRPPPATLGVGLVMSSGGVMAGSRLVVSAEWVEMMRRLVQAGVLSLPAVSAAVRIHGGQVMMAQARQDLPEGVREALGDSPEVRGMQVTGKAGAGMADAPRHHVLPKEHRRWFEQRGFKGDMDIDQFCVRLERAYHEAIHGGGNWKLGRTWPGEWSRMIMEALYEAETTTGRRLTNSEVLNIVAERMRSYDIPMKFIKGRSR
ncbi:TIGR02269 family lipoprotein [Corallococcus macrosporus]|nr:TIGR02269 family lipoprotein [Corallococcus macrosporus]